MHYIVALITTSLEPGGFIAWLLVGLISGFLAGKVMRGSGYGLFGDIIVGLLGAFIGSWLADILGLGNSYGLVGSIIIAFLGSCVLLGILRLFSRGRA